ncbi:MAG TPA: transporter [Ohtaekwangia sp.]
MKKIALCFLLTLIILAWKANAQTVEKPDLVTDRPDQTEAPVLVPRGGLQVETGFIFEKDKSKAVDATNYTYNTTLVKYGVNENFELRLITEYLSEKARTTEAGSTKVQGISPLALGLKVKIADEKGFWPQAAMIGHINLRTGSSEFEPKYTAVDFRFTFAHTLSEKFALSYNVGAEWDGESPDATFIYTASLGYAISDKAGVFIEGYSFFPERYKADNRADAGITYKFTPLFQFDISGGIGLSENAPDYFVSTGVSFRFFK